MPSPTAGRPRRPGEEAAVREVAHPDGEGDEGMEHRKEARQEDGDAAPTREIALGAHPVRLAHSTPHPGGPDVRTDPPPQPEADALTDQGTDQHGDDHRRGLCRARDADGRDEDDRVAGHDEPDQDAGLEEDRHTRDECAGDRVDRTYEIDQPRYEVLHSLRIREHPGPRLERCANA